MAVEDMRDMETWRDRLAHVCWIGGPPDAGKSTVADLLGEWFGATVYTQDRHEMEQLRSADRQRYPLHAALRERLDRQDQAAFFEEGWLGAGVSAMAASARANWTERIGLVCEDLATLPPDRPIVAEGPGFFPDVIAPLLQGVSQAIWLIPTEAFKRTSHVRRDKSAWRFVTSDPAKALANHISRDLLFAESLRAEVTAAGLPWIEVDGRADARSLAHRVARHFGDRLNTSQHSNAAP